MEAAIDRAAVYISKRTRCSSHYVADEKRCGFAVVRDAKRCGTFTTRSAKDCGHEYVVSASLCGSDRITSVRCGVKRATSGSVCGFDVELASGKRTPRTCNVPKTCDMPVSRGLALLQPTLFMFFFFPSHEMLLCDINRNDASFLQNARWRRAAR